MAKMEMTFLIQLPKMLSLFFMSSITLISKREKHKCYLLQEIVGWTNGPYAEFPYILNFSLIGMLDY